MIIYEFAGLGKSSTASLEKGIIAIDACMLSKIYKSSEQRDAYVDDAYESHKRGYIALTNIHHVLSETLDTKRAAPIYISCYRVGRTVDC